MDDAWYSVTLPDVAEHKHALHQDSLILIPSESSLSLFGLLSRHFNLPKMCIAGFFSFPLTRSTGINTAVLSHTTGAEAVSQNQFLSTRGRVPLKEL